LDKKDLEDLKKIDFILNLILRKKVIVMDNNKEEIISLKSIFNNISFIGTRPSGEIIRKKIDNAIAVGKKAIIDFDGIDGITQSFGDEIIGIYVRFFGSDYIKKNIQAINYNEEIKTILNWVVRYSNEMAEKEIKKYHSCLVDHPALYVS